MAGTDISAVVAGIKNRQLQTQIKSQKAKVEAQGGKVKKGGPSILSRTFDILSRPIYGVSEGLARVSEQVGPDGKRKGGVGDVLKGVVGGLAGKNKTYMSDTLLRAAEADRGSFLSETIRENKGNFRTIAGFAGDVVLDPTTYIGAGIVRKGAEGAARTAGMRAVAEGLKGADSVKAIEEAAKLAKIAKGESALQAGKEVSEKALGKAGTKAAKGKEAEIYKTLQETVGKPAYDAAKLTAEGGKGHVAVKFAGKTVARLEKPYAGVAKLGEIVGRTDVGKSLNEAFRTGAKFPETTNALRRKVQLAGIANAENDIKGMRAFFKELTNDEKKLIAHAIEQGSVKDVAKLTAEGVPIEAATKASNLHGVMSKSGKDMGEYVDEAKRILNTFGLDEVDAGVFRDSAKLEKLAKEHLIDNYVPHYYEGGTKAEQELAKKARRIKVIGPDKPGFTMQRTLPTLAEAKAKNLKPMENIDDILARRTAKHYQAIARAKYVDGVVKEYGVTAANKNVRQLMKDGKFRGVDSPYVPKDVVMPDHIAKSLEVMENMHNGDELYNKFLNVFDNVQNQWKFGATALNPGHHIRNMIGDSWNNFLDGVDNPYRYKQSMNVLRDPEKFVMRIGDTTMTGTELMSHNIRSGARPGFTLSELTQDAAGAVGSFKGVKGKIANVSEKREEFMRMAHYIDALKDEGKLLKKNSPTYAADLEKAADRAAARVRKWNIDYGDVTDFERNVMKRAMPFYTWSRKNLPLQLEALAMKPGRVAVAPKGMNAIQQLLGGESDYNRGDLGNIPKWLKEMAPVRLKGEGEGGNAVYWVPSLPFADISKYTEGGKEGIFRSLVSQISPIARIPVEQATGEQIFSGAPTGGMAEYGAGQVPLARTLYAMLSGKQSPTSIKTLNYLTGAGAYEVTPSQEAGELRRQQDPLQAQLRSIRQKYRDKAMGK